MTEAPKKVGLFRTQTAVRIRKVCGTFLLIIGGSILGLGWYQTEESGVIHGLGGMAAGAMFVMTGLMALEEASLIGGKGSKRLRSVYASMAVAFTCVMLYILFWLDK